MDRGPADREREASSGAFSTLIERLASLAFQLCSDLLRFTYAIVRPFAPQLIPLVLVILVLPILVFVSLSAGFVVWKTSVVSWEEPIFLQYGCVLSTFRPHSMYSTRLKRWTTSVR
jgi:hypothetical protein